MSRLLSVLMVTASAIAIAAAPPPRRSAAAPREEPPLRVCADPNNLPFTNDRLEGFENRLADLLARDLGTTVSYTWWAQRRGFIRNTLNAERCDVVMGLPSRMDMARTTRPYYTSTYVFVIKAGRHRVSSFDDPMLRRLRVGVPLIGDDGASTPPAAALAQRGLVRNLVGYSVYGDYRTNSPPSNLITAVARGEVDVAAAWGPLAGYFAARQPVPLTITPVQDPSTETIPFTFGISMAVRRGDTGRLATLDAFLDRRRAEIDAILAAYHVPRVQPGAERAGKAGRAAEGGKTARPGRVETNGGGV